MNNQQNAPPGRETPRAFEVYSIYEALGSDRSLQKVRAYYEKLATTHPPETGQEPAYIPSLSTLKSWSTQHGWAARLIEAESNALAARRIKRQAEIDQMDEHHALIGRMQALALVALLQGKIKDGTIGTVAAVNYFNILVQLERTARGAANTRLEQSLSGPGGMPIQLGGVVGFYEVELPQKNPEPLNEPDVEPEHL